MLTFSGKINMKKSDEKCCKIRKNLEKTLDLRRYLCYNLFGFLFLYNKMFKLYCMGSYANEKNCYYHGKRQRFTDR